MIIQVRGANGSGKSTLVRRVLDGYSIKLETMRPSRGGRPPRPLYYSCVDPHREPVTILGSYLNPTGGCDTIPDVETVFALADTLGEGGANVLFEGILAQHSATRVLSLRDHGHDVRLIALTTPLEECVASVRKRREERGDDRPLDPTNVEKEWRGVQSAARRLRGDGVSVEHLDREAAYARVIELLCTHVWSPPVDFATFCTRCSTRRPIVEEVPA